MNAQYKEISDKAFFSSDMELCEKLTTNILRRESKASGCAIGLMRGKQSLNIVFAFVPLNRIEICWTKLSLDNPTPCEEIARFIAKKTGKDIENRIMGMCYQIISVITKPVSQRLLGLNKKNYPHEIEDKNRALEMYLHSGKGERYEAVLELLTQQ